MSFGRCDYNVGDLVLFLENVEWERVTCIQGEIGIVAKIVPPEDPKDFFDLHIQLADGGRIPVWCGEIEKLQSPDLTKKKK